MGLIGHKRVRIPEREQVDIGVVPDAVATEAQFGDVPERGHHICMEHIVVEFGGLQVFDKEHEMTVSA